MRSVTWLGLRVGREVAVPGGGGRRGPQNNRVGGRRATGGTGVWGWEVQG